MSKALMIIAIVACNSFAFGQHSFFTPKDTLSKARFIGVSAGIVGSWTGSMTGLWQVWYTGPKTSWHSFDDSKNWLQMDKAGHFYTAYKLNGLCTDLYRWTGYNKRRSLWLGTGVSLGFQTTLELFDATNVEWGFSWSDMAANAAGNVAYVAQDLIWEEQRIIPKISFHPTEYSDIRPEVLGENYLQALLKDYNGQTYWLSFNLRKFIPESKIPKWMCVSLGYSVDQKLKGTEEIYTDPSTGFTYHSQREFLLSMDIDFSELNVRRPWLKAIVKQFNYLKIPFPTLLYRNDLFYLKPFYF